MSMRPFRGRSRTDFGSTTSPTLASVVRSTAASLVTSTTALTLESLSSTSSVICWPTSRLTVCVNTANPLASTVSLYSPGSSPVSWNTPCSLVPAWRAACVLAEVTCTAAPGTAWCCGSKTVPLSVA